MAANDLERLIVQLSADIKKYENAMRKAQGVTNTRLGNIQKKATKTGKSVETSFLRAGTAIAGAFVARDAVRGMINLSEAATRIDNSLKVAGVSGDELESTFTALSKAALDNGAPIESLVTLYGRAALVQKELGISSQELLGFTENVAVALRVAGTDAQSASGALLQLSQALGSGVVRAEEFNSILEGALPIAQAAARGLKEAGGSVAELRKLVIDGKVPSEAFFRAFEAGSDMLRDKADKATFTLAQSTNNLYTALIKVTREFNNSTGASENFAKGINSVADGISSLDVTGFIQKLRDASGELEGFFNNIGNASIFDEINKALGLVNEDGLVINLDKEEAESKTNDLDREVKLLQERIALNTELGFDNTEALARLGEVQAALASVGAAAAALPEYLDPVPAGSSGPPTRNGPRRVKVKVVSLDDFENDDDDDDGGGGKSKQSDYAREIEQIRQRTVALQAETAAMAGLNPLIQDYGYTLEKASATQDLLTAAQSAGLEITPALRASIEDLASGYAAASSEAQRLQESQESIRAAAEDFKSTAKDITSGFISDLREGKSAAEALAGALNKVADKLIDVGLNAAFGLGGGGGGSGIGSFIGSLFGGFKDGGKVPGYANGGRIVGPGSGRSDSIPAIGPKGPLAVSNGEYIVNANATRKNLALLEAINSGRRFADGGAVGSAPRLPSMTATGTASSDTVNIVLTDDSGRMAAIADQRIHTASGSIIRVSVQQSVKAVDQNLPEMVSNVQKRG